MDIDEDGRLFVLEMPGYPLDTHPTGRVKVLEDTDGDGRYETSHVFADNLVLPTGIMRWKKGVLVTSAPDVLYLEDTDGDGRADQRTRSSSPALPSPIRSTWSTGRPTGSTTGSTSPMKDRRGRHLQGPVRRSRVAAAMARAPATVPTLHASTGAACGCGPTLAGSSCSPAIRSTATASTHGDTTSPTTTPIMRGTRSSPRAYLARNPDLLVESAMADIPDHGEAARVFPITHRPALRAADRSGAVHVRLCHHARTRVVRSRRPEVRRSSSQSPCTISCIATSWCPAGATFVARRAEDGREFLASTDSWFRPVFLYIGPDGALYVVDFYRARIEHPEWTSSDLQKNPAPMYEGQNRGRIYRISREGTEPGAPPALGRGGYRCARECSRERQPVVASHRTAPAARSPSTRRCAAAHEARILADHRTADSTRCGRSMDSARWTMGS